MRDELAGGVHVRRKRDSVERRLSLDMRGYDVLTWNEI